MRIKISLLILLSIFLYNVQAQNDSSESNYLVKTNMLYALTGTINASMECKFSDNVSAEFSVNLNPWDYGSWTMRHFLFQPEIRYWLKQTYDHAFIGAHLIYANYNFAGLKLPFGIYGGYDLREYRYEGNFYGFGIATGYQWHFNKSWGMEASFGIGYTYWSYDKFLIDSKRPHSEGVFLEHERGGLISLTKIGLSLVYRINNN